jgi:UTP--glucose-1-phosphate uridylyltransferase
VDAPDKERKTKMNAKTARPVRKAVFPVAGMGTRFLPATKAVPKEMLPVVDKPVIQYAVEEAKAAGIDQFIFVTGRGKHIIEDHFDHAYELEALLSSRERHSELESLLEALPPSGSVSFTRQQNPLGLGHAVWCARHFIGDEPFAVLLPDELLVDQPGCLQRMVTAYENTGGCMLAVREVPLEETRRYGIIDPISEANGLIGVKGIVEKPQPHLAPSRMAVIGRYILPPQVFTELDRHEKGAGGEIQLTDALAKLIGHQPFNGFRFEGQRFDCGDKVGFLHANVVVGLSRPDTAGPLKEILKSLAI